MNPEKESFNIPQRIDNTDSIEQAMLSAKIDVTLALGDSAEEQETIETGSVLKYIEELGYEYNSPILFVAPEDLPFIKETYQKYGLVLDFPDETTRGFAIGSSFDSEFIFIVRDPEVEKANGGTTYLKGTAVHEILHAVARHGSIYRESKGGGFHRASYRNGLGLRYNLTGENEHSTGSFFEEGWVDFMSADFVAKTISDEEKQKIYKEIATVISDIKPEEISFENELTFTVEGVTVGVPTKYWSFSKTGELLPDTSMIAGAAIELLCKANPALYDAFKKTREGVEGLREVAKEINKISSGLYEKLRALQYNGVDFAKGYQIVEEVLQNKQAQE